MRDNLLDLDAKLAEMLLVPHVLIGVSGFIEREDLVIDNRMDVVHFDGAVHVLELQSTADKNTANSADVYQTVQEAWLLLCHATHEADDGDDTVDSNGCEGL